MKKKEIIQLVVAVAIFFAAGILIYTQLVGGKTGKDGAAQGVQVEVVKPLPAGFGADSMAKLTDIQLNRDFYAEPNLQVGLGNAQPFGR